MSLPKGGGAIRGIGESFATDPATGTGSLSVPVATSPGRSGFGPDLTLTYGSGAGNGLFGFGWNLAQPAVNRKTDNGLPQYRDAEDSDVFTFGGEDLVPAYAKDDDGDWILDAVGNHVFDQVERDSWTVRRYRPRRESTHTRIERWTSAAGDVHWRCVSADNVTSVFGTDDNSRIADPEAAAAGAPARVFSWLIRASYDDKGNAISYEYCAEDGRGVDVGRACEARRSDRSRAANRYLERIRYGNRTPNRDPNWISTDPRHLTDYMFQVVLDYGEGHYTELPSDKDGREFAAASPEPVGSPPWPVRLDPFSSYRAGFELRTYRLCRRILMFHCFPAELGVKDYLVRSTEFSYAQSPVASFLVGVTQSGFTRAPAADEPARYRKQSLPTLELTYSSLPDSQDLAGRAVQYADSGTIPGAAVPMLVDLDGEGAAGLLVESSGEWLYRHNLSANNAVPTGDGVVAARFGPVEPVSTRPAHSLGAGRRLVDVAGDGTVDLLVTDDGTWGYYERSGAAGWAAFHPFGARPNLDARDRGVRHIDLTGDGSTDLLIAEDEALVWYPSLTRDGYDAARRVIDACDAEAAATLLYLDDAEATFLADCSGDGLTDLLRIRNGEVVYWPNLGYGRFGRKVVMDNAPWFDRPDLFDPQRLRLADVDGSGATDIVYPAHDGLRIFLNQSGNAWRDPVTLPQVTAREAARSLEVVDLLGQGTACVVWTPRSPEAGRPALHYIDLLQGRKPYLLTRADNNLGTRTKVHYSSSTRFYLDDLLAGRPWITRLPFPVQVIDRIETHDLVTGNRLVSRHTYHHGHFVEREFRGFGMVESWNAEQVTSSSRDVPPAHTRTWFHTGYHAGGQHVSDYYAGLLDATDTGEYYREPSATDAQARSLLLADTVLPGDLTAAEEREACRALKGSMLRQETYAQDGTARAAHPYVVTEQNLAVRMSQPRGTNEHAVFATHQHEAITYHYEREPADPRVTHTLDLEVDPYGNVLRTVTIGYGRRRPEPGLAPEEQAVQARLLATYTYNRVTNAIDTAQNFRAPLPSETRTYEIHGLVLPPDQPRFSFEQVLAAASAAMPVDYEATDASAQLRKRTIEHIRTVYRRDDLSGPLPPHTLHPLALPFETYTLALTPGLVSAVYGDRVPDKMLREAGYVAGAEDANWWMPSGRVHYSPAPDASTAAELSYARRHFFLPCRFRDPFHTSTARTESVVTYDSHDLLVQETCDACGNRVTVGERDTDPERPVVRSGMDYRVLQPALIMDANRNRVATAFDTLGMVVGTATMGKPEQSPAAGDVLSAAFRPDLARAEIEAVLTDPLGPQAVAALGKATTRIVYDLHASRPAAAPLAAPIAAVTLTRETHAGDPVSAAGVRIHATVSYWDGFGRQIQRKAQAEPAPGSGATRWIGSGWTVFNNKNKAVRQYEPFFSNTHGYEAENLHGVSSTLYYDPMDRVVATLYPDHTWQKVVFGPWRQEDWDAHDTALIADPAQDPDVGTHFTGMPSEDYLPTWHAARTEAAEAAQRWPGPQRQASERRAAEKAAVHAATPAVSHTDSLGRPWLTVAHNRFRYSNSPPLATATEGFYRSRTDLDLEGNPRTVTDARGRVVLRHDYDIVGNRIHQASMEAGERWTLQDVTGNGIRSWDGAGTMEWTEYDVLRRPVRKFLKSGEAKALMVERVAYGESGPAPETTNVRTRVVQVCDQAGMVTTDRFDFKGNLVRSRRQVARVYDAVLDWSGQVPLEPEVYTVRTWYDALDRPVQVIPPHSGNRADVLQHAYNAGGLLESIVTWLGLTAEPTTVLDPATATQVIVKDINYDANGRRVSIAYANGAVTSYAYDRDTSRLTELLTVRGTVALQRLSYIHDAVGNVIEQRDDAQPTLFFRNKRVEPTATFTYDAVYRLIEATGREHVGQSASYRDSDRISLPLLTDGNAMGRYLERYHHDEVGNLQLVQHVSTDPATPGWSRAYHYSERSQLRPADLSNRLSSTTAVGVAVEPYSIGGDGYDVHGNLLRMPHLQEVRWNQRNQMRMSRRQAVNASDTDGVAHHGERTWYVYDAAGERVRKVTESAPGTIRSSRLYLGGFEIYRRTGTGALVRETLHVMDDERRVALIDTRVSGTEQGVPARLVRFQLGNHLGSVSLELDERAEVISFEEYTPYGATACQAVRRDIGVVGKRYRYTGKERDEESGLSFHGARYYAPWLARWISTDPSTTVDGPNLYVYCRGNPIRYADPDGHQVTGLPTILGSGRYGWLHTVPGFTREHVIPGSWLKYVLEAEYGSAAAGAVEGRVYRNAWTMLLDNSYAGPKTRFDLSYAAELRKLGQNIESTDFYLRSMRHLQAGGSLSPQDLAYSHNTAVREVATFVKAEGQLTSAAAGNKLSRDLSSALAPGTGAAPVSAPQVPVVSFAKKVAAAAPPAPQPSAWRQFTGKLATARNWATGKAVVAAEIGEKLNRFLQFGLAIWGAARATESLTSQDVNQRLNVYYTARDEPNAGERLVFFTGALGIGLLEAASVGVRAGVGDVDWGTYVANSYSRQGMSPSQREFTEWARIEFGLVPDRR
ncbi:SpvB/TcaC N-terminal domain-containing protein [Actinoplanes auranticolor]|uniref:SpvB/TcaC N-terminal domain-containing protein n=1 Tax=Actinoplanes auranticolor TaxID=47988 RepID=UPI001BB3D0A5|nr:SpvB/TcaC N-terminal domain-containing protein [Actinoplanes auranticolor]